MGLLDYISAIGQWILSNFGKLTFSLVAVIAGYVLHKVIARELTRLRKEKRLEEHLAHTLTRISQWGAVLVVLSAILVQFGVTIGMISGLFTLKVTDQFVEFTILFWSEQSCIWISDHTRLFLL